MNFENNRYSLPYQNYKKVFTKSMKFSFLAGNPDLWLLSKFLSKIKPAETKHEIEIVNQYHLILQFKE